MAFLIGGANSAVSGYDIENSMRFNRDDSPRLTDTTNATGDKQKFTVSAWVKHHYKGSGGQYIWNMYHGSPSDANWIAFGFNADSKFACQSWNSDLSLLSTAQHRDPSAWYHVVLAVDTTQSTEALRARVYINVSEITAWGTENRPDQNHEYNAIGTSGATIAIGCAFNDGSPPAAYGFQEFYLADFYFIDGTQYAPGDFGETDEDSGIWKPKDAKDDLTFGSNGLFLEFGTSGTLGEDTSGNSDDLTSTNLAATDQATDTPTNNFATFNPLDNYYQQYTYAEGNLKVSTNADYYNWNTSTIGVTSGKWYVEGKMTQSGPGTDNWVFGVASYQVTNNNHGLGADNFGIAYRNNGNYKTGDANTTHGASFSTNDIVMIALDLDNDNVYFGHGGQWADGSGNTDESSPNSAVSLSTLRGSSTYGDTVFFAFGDWNSNAASTVSIGEFNFGNPPYANSSSVADANGYGAFEYAPPSGYYALCTKNLAEYG